MKRNEALEEIREFTIDKLEDLKGYYTDSVCDLHNELFNTDYYIIGRFEAKEWLGSETFDAIDEIQEYEKDHFGELYTDLSEPEKVVNMYVYILGEGILYEAGINDYWEEDATEEIIDNLISNLKKD